MNKLKFLLAPVLLAIALNVTAQSLPSIKLEPVYKNLTGERPLWMCEAPDGSGRMFVVYQDGKIVVFKKGSNGGDAKEFLNIENRHPHFQNEDGLLSLAFHPGFKTNGLFYIFYTQENPAGQLPKFQNGLPTAFPYRSIISELKVSADDPDKADLSSERILLTVPGPFWNHKGGELLFGHDGYLYASFGDGGRGDDPFGNGQNTATLLGKIIRIDVDSHAETGRGARKHELPYGIPSDNPFIHEPGMGGLGAHHEIYAYGFRNVWRYSFDRATGALWAGDVGQDLWEEVDIVVKGGNYGWSVREGTHHFKPGPEGAKYIDPIMEYCHNAHWKSQGLYPDHPTGNCIVGGYVYRGKQFPALDGIYLYADYSPGTIYGLRYDYAARKVTAHGEFLRITDGITSFAEDGDGELYVLTQSGQIFHIVAL